MADPGFGLFPPEGSISKEELASYWPEGKHPDYPGVDGTKHPNYQGGPHYAQDVYRERMLGAYNAQLQAAKDIQSNRNYVGQQQVMKGAARARDAMQRQASALGANPSAMRAAQYQGAQVAARGNLLGKEMRLKEQAAREQMMLGVLGQRAQIEGQLMDDHYRRFLAEQQHRTQMERQQAQEDAADQAFAGQMIGAGLGAAGSLMSSDERVKDPVSPLALFVASKKAKRSGNQAEAERLSLASQRKAKQKRKAR